MNHTLHLLSKDLKYARFWVLATWSLAAMALFFPLVPAENRMDVAGWLILFRYGSWVLLFLTVAHAVLLDAPAREGAFFRTLPISLPEWLGSKLLFALVLILPMALIQLVMILFMGLAPGLPDLLLLFAEDLLAHSIVAVLGLAMAARKPSHPQFYASLAIWVGILLFGLFISSSVLELMQRTEKPQWSYSGEYLSLSQILVGSVLTIVGVLVVLVIFSRNRKISTLGMPLLGVLLVSHLVTIVWPVNFVEMMADSEAEAPRSEWPDADQIQMEFTETKSGRRNKGMFSSSNANWNGITYRTITANAELRGLPENWYAFKNAYDSETDLSNGKVIFSSEEANGKVNERLILPGVGIPSYSDLAERSNQLGVKIAEVSLPAATGAMEDARIRGEVEIPFVRPVVLARIPLRAGESVSVGDRRYLVTSASQNGDEIRFQVLHEYPLVALRGGFNSTPHRNISFMVINEGQRSYQGRGASGSSGTRVGHYGIQYFDSRGEIDRDYKEELGVNPEVKGWLDGAELLIVGQENGGSITKKFDFSGISLSNARGD